MLSLFISTFAQNITLNKLLPNWITLWKFRVSFFGYSAMFNLQQRNKQYSSNKYYNFNVIFVRVV